MEYLKLLLVVIVLVALAVAGLSIKIILKKKGQFPNTHISGNKALRNRGITCVQSQDRQEQAKTIRTP